jgi:L-lactate dehydrogenase complex protein LldF
MSAKHAEAAARFVADTKLRAWHDETLFLVREKRDRQAESLPEWEALRTLASELKMHTLTHLDRYAERFAEKAETNGAIVHWAKDAREHNEIVHGLLAARRVKKLVKSKSMLTEECHLNPYLIERGIEVVETDLGERILQWMDLPPGHIVMPAIHIKRQEVGRLFEEKLGTEAGNSDPAYLTHAARRHLREQFLGADAGMTGCNFAVAETGEAVVCTNEGNADMGVAFAKLHIVSLGLEKIVPDARALGVYTRLLARSATGQPVTSYLSHFRNPRAGGELHFVLVDNGRSDILGDSRHRQTLKCLRCAACMNTCPVYRRSGGYSNAYFIPGPIGINLGMLRSPREYHGDVSACTFCASCNDICPARIDLAGQIYQWRQTLDARGQANPMKKFLSFSLRRLFLHPALYGMALKLAPLLNRLPRFLVYSRFNVWGIGREMPVFGESFSALWRKGKVKKARNQ